MSLNEPSNYSSQNKKPFLENASGRVFSIYGSFRQYLVRCLIKTPRYFKLLFYLNGLLILQISGYFYAVILNKIDLLSVFSLKFPTKTKKCEKIEKFSFFYISKAGVDFYDMPKIIF